MQVTIVVLLAAALAAFTYLHLERLGRRAIVPLLARAIAGSALGVLLLNVACPVTPAARRPLVLLDGSLSLAGAGGHWREARDSALRWGDVRLFGDERGGEDTLPNRGRSLLAPALVAAAGADRPVIVVTDGEIEDAADVPADLLARVGVRVFPRDSADDVAITDVTGPARVTRGDSVALDVAIRAVRGPAPDSVTVAVDAGDTRLARRVVRRVPPATQARVPEQRRRASGSRPPVSRRAITSSTSRSRSIGMPSRAPTSGCISSRWWQRRGWCCSPLPPTGTAASYIVR